MTGAGEDSRTSTGGGTGEAPLSPFEGREPNDNVPVWRNPYVLATVVGVVMVTALRPFLMHVPDPPPVMGKIPEFELVSQDGKAFGSGDLAGQVYIVSFFFTSCPSICPKLMAAMGKLQARYARENVPIRLVSISVDPETDTPEKLTEYIKKSGITAANWVFLTGTEGEVRRLAEAGFMTHLGGKLRVEGGLFDIAHTGQFALVDGAGNLRGYYNTDDTGLDEIFHRSRHVMAPGRR